MKNSTKWITGLKGITALIIFIHHFALFFYPGFIDCAPGNTRTSIGLEYKIAMTPLNIFSWGGIAGVCIFFTVSGFLIAYNFYVRKSDYGAEYIVKRYLKLMFPVLLSSIIIFFIIKSNLFRTDKLIEMYSKIGLRNNYSGYNPNLLSVIWESTINLFRTSSFPINPPMWTMKYELIYSIIAVTLISAVGNSKYRYIIYSVMILIVLNSYFLCFILGILLCDIWINQRSFIEKINSFDIRIILILLSLFLLSSTYANQGKMFYLILNNLFIDIDYLVVFHSIVASLLILFLLLSERIRNLLSKKIFMYFGKKSLYIYLFHWVIINTFSMFIALILNNYIQYYQAAIISFFISFFILLLFSKYFGEYITKIVNALVNEINLKFSKSK